MDEKALEAAKVAAIKNMHETSKADAIDEGVVCSAVCAAIEAYERALASEEDTPHLTAPPCMTCKAEGAKHGYEEREPATYVSMRYDPFFFCNSHADLALVAGFRPVRISDPEGQERLREHWKQKEAGRPLPTPPEGK